MKNYSFFLLLNSMLYITAPAMAMHIMDEYAELTPTSHPIQAQKEPSTNSWVVETDDNNWANYQLYSRRFPVKPGQSITVSYDLDVDGIMSFGLLNTARDGWNGPEEVLNTGYYNNGSFTRVVPEGESESSIVLRNYHLDSNGGAGKTKFILKSLKMNIVNMHVNIIDMHVMDEYVEFTPTSHPVQAQKEPSTNFWVVETDDNNWASYQLYSRRFPVKPGQSITVSYCLDVDGIMSFGLLNTARNAWNGPEEILNTGNYYNKSFTRVVPEGESESSIVLRNYHLDGNGGKTNFTLSNLRMTIMEKVNPERIARTSLTHGQGQDVLSQVSALSIFQLEEGTEFSFNSPNVGHSISLNGVDPARKFIVTSKSGTLSNVAEFNGFLNYLKTAPDAYAHFNPQSLVIWDEGTKSWTFKISTCILMNGNSYMFHGNDGQILLPDYLSVTFKEVGVSEPS